MARVRETFRFFRAILDFRGGFRGSLGNRKPHALQSLKVFSQTLSPCRGWNLHPRHLDMQKPRQIGQGYPDLSEIIPDCRRGLIRQLAECGSQSIRRLRDKSHDPRGTHSNPSVAAGRPTAGRLAGEALPSFALGRIGGDREVVKALRPIDPRRDAAAIQPERSSAKLRRAVTPPPACSSRRWSCLSFLPGLCDTIPLRVQQALHILVGRAFQPDVFIPR